ncbi:hypothetical protein [Vibrio owensii]|uniref:hypothetical protein n=1 Tax=Vibrio owensii TaxID=696485 RepID=UPI004069886F
MRVPLEITEQNFITPGVAYVYGGLLDPENPQDFTLQFFPRCSALHLYQLDNALQHISKDFSAELYELDLSHGLAKRKTHRINGSAFPERIQADYLIENHAQTVIQGLYSAIKTDFDSFAKIAEKELDQYFQVTVIEPATKIDDL